MANAANKGNYKDIKVVVWCNANVFEADGPVRHIDTINILNKKNVQNVLMLGQKPSVDVMNAPQMSRFTQVIISKDFQKSMKKIEDTLFLKPHEMLIVSDREGLDLTGIKILKDSECDAVLQREFTKGAADITDTVPEEVRKYREQSGSLNLDEKIDLLRTIVGKYNLSWAKHELVDFLIKRNAETDLKEAYLMCSVGSAFNDPELILRHAKMLKEGLGVDRNLTEYARLIKMAINKRSKMAEYEWADFVIKTKSKDNYPDVFKRCVGSKDLLLKAQLARMYRDGYGTDVNLDKAIDCMREAADADVKQTKNELTDLLLQRGKPKDLKEAFERCTALVQDKDYWAMGRLARMYRDGNGTKKDLDHAIEYMKTSLDAGVAWAGEELTEMLLTRKNEGDMQEAVSLIFTTAKNKSKSLSVLSAAAKKGERECVDCVLSEIKKNGVNDEMLAPVTQFFIDVGDSEGIKYMTDKCKDAAAAGNPGASFLVGKMYKDGVGTGVDLDMAISYMRSSMSGVSRGQTNEYADALLKRGGAEDKKEAFELCTLNSKEGDYWALGRVARMYRDGIFVVRDEDVAIKYMRTAAENGVTWARNELANMLRRRGTSSDLSEIKKMKLGV